MIHLLSTNMKEIQEVKRENIHVNGEAPTKTAAMKPTRITIKCRTRMQITVTISAQIRRKHIHTFSYTQNTDK